MIGTLLRLMDYKPFRGHKGTEDLIAIEIADYLRAATLEGRLRATWTNIPHEVGAVAKGSAFFKAAQSRYAKAKAMGLITGSTDFVFVWADGGGWIEIKSPGGSLSPAQKDFREWAGATGSRHAVCRTLDQVVENLIAWGVLRL